MTGDRVERRRERLVSLDVFRGITIASMLLVNTPGTWAAIYPPLRHAEWHGWTPTDLIFPYFIFIVGITTQLSVGARRARGDGESAIRAQILRRGALIFLFGLLLNGFPFFTWGEVAGQPDANFLDRVVDRLRHWRIMGVLQRIALAYVVTALIATRARLRTQVAITVALLLGYWLVLTALPVPGSGGVLGAHLLDDPQRNMAAWWDRLMLDWSGAGLGNHLWVNSRTWDPEGVLSTAGAVATAMFGNLAGRWLAQPRPLSERVSALAATGALAIVAGLVWHWILPINKSLWTSSYVVFTAGMAALTLATIMWMVDTMQWRAWTRPFVIYGVNPLIAFVGSGIMARLIYSIIKVQRDGATTSLQAAIFEGAFASWLSPVNASLAFALAFVVLWLAILWALYRKRIFISV